MGRLAYLCFKVAAHGGVLPMIMGLLAVCAIGGMIWLVVVRLLRPFKPDSLQMSPIEFRYVFRGREISAPWGDVSAVEECYVGQGKYKHQVIKVTAAGERLSLDPSKFVLAGPDLLLLINAGRSGRPEVLDEWLTRQHPAKPIHEVAWVLAGVAVVVLASHFLIGMP
jgi:hypothetical protein